MQIDDINRHYSNGRSKLVRDTSLHVIQNINECKKLWKTFSPNKVLFDDWDFRYQFHKAYKYTPYFISLMKNNRPTALLPLDYDSVNHRYQWFGGEWQEENTFFSDNDEIIPFLLALAPRPLFLYAIDEKSTLSINNMIKFDYCDPKYIVKLDGYKSDTNFLSQLKKKKRYNLKRDIAYIEGFGPQVIIDKRNDFQMINQLVTSRFHSKSELADYEKDPPVSKAFNNIFNTSNTQFQTRLFSIYINGVCEASDMNIIYNETYYTPRGGNHVKKYPGIGNYMFYKEIADALSLGLKTIDFHQMDYGWKHKWFEELRLYKYTAI